MPILSSRTAILHVEDDQGLAKMARFSLVKLGYQGQVFHAERVAEAIAMLDDRAQRKAPLDLILLDMLLPDGTGLEVLRHAKASTAWQKTPVIFLSGETDPCIIDEAYALGANCYLPKCPRNKEVSASLRALYECWIEGALTSGPTFAEQARDILARGARLRARAANLYLGLSRLFRADQAREAFWLDRALVEGNLASLMTFLQEQAQCGTPPILPNRMVALQDGTARALDAAERFLAGKPVPQDEGLWPHILATLESWDEEVFAAAFAALLAQAPAIVEALRTRLSRQLHDVSRHIADMTRDPAVRRRAEALEAFAARLGRKDFAEFRGHPL